MRLRPFTLAGISVILSVTVLAQPALAKPKVAVLGLEVTGDSAMDQKATEAAKSLTRELRREAGRSGGAFELAPNSSRDLLEMKLLNNCSDEGNRCMSEIGRQLGADRLIYGKVERTRRGYRVELHLLDTQNSAPLNHVREGIPASDAAAAGGMLRHARSFYGQLTGAEAEGALAITASAERGTVYVDGQIRTSLSAGSARVSGLTAGVHAVAIEARGFERFETEVNIEAGETRNLRAALVELEVDPAGEVVATDENPGRGWRIAFWSGALVAAGAGAGWTYYGIQVRKEEDRVQELTGTYMHPGGEQLPTFVPATDGNEPFYRDACVAFGSSRADEVANGSPQLGTLIGDIRNHCDRGDNFEKLVNFVWIPATAAAVVFTAFAGYKGYLAPKRSSPERDVAGKRRSSRPRLTVTPALGPTLVGAGLELQF